MTHTHNSSPYNPNPNLEQVVLIAMGAVFGMLDNASDALGSVGRYMSNLNKVEDSTHASSPTSRGSTSQEYTTGDRFGAQGSGVSGALLDGTMSLGKGIVGGTRQPRASGEEGKLSIRSNAAEALGMVPGWPLRQRHRSAE